MRSHGPIAVALAAATLAVYAPVREHAFLNLDDLVYLARAADGLDWKTFVEAFTTPYFSNWIPLTTLSLALDYTLYGRNAAAFLATNAALHVVVTLLLYAALVRMTDAPWRSGFVAGVFALHPLHVENVAWMSQRKDVLCGVFFAGSLLLYARYVEAPSWRRGLAVTLGFALGLLAKPMVLTLPFVLLLLDYWPLNRLGRGPSGLPSREALARAVREKLPLFALVALFAVIAFATQQDSPAMGHAVDLGLDARLANAVDSYGAYLLDSFWPSGLAAFYPHPLDGIPAWRSGLATLALVGITLALVRAAGSHPYAIVGWLWFLGTLVPMIGWVQIGPQARADRYMYFPLIGLAIAVAWMTERAFARWQIGRGVAFGVGVGVLAALGLASAHTIPHWRDSISLYARAAAVTRGNWLAHHGLASALRAAGREDEALPHLERALALRPDWGRAQIEMAEVLAERGETRRALEHYERGLELAPEHARARINYGHALLRTGRAQNARREFERALADGESSLSRVHRASARRGRGLAALEEGLLDEAARDFERADSLGRPAPQLLGRLADAYARSGRLEDARRAAERGAAQAARSGDDALADQLRRRMQSYRSSSEIRSPDL